MAKRLNVNLSDEVADALRRIADDDGVSITEAVRRSISTETYLRDAKSRGEKILLSNPDTNQIREVVFR